jgi:hypothetical protein
MVTRKKKNRKPFLILDINVGTGKYFGSIIKFRKGRIVLYDEDDPK